MQSVLNCLPLASADDPAGESLRSVALRLSEIAPRGLSGEAYNNNNNYRDWFERSDNLSRAVKQFQQRGQNSR